MYLEIQIQKGCGSLKKIIILIVFILVLTSCSYINNTGEDDKTKDESGNSGIRIDVIDKFNPSAINDNGNQLATDGSCIYYIHPHDNFIYRINLNGTDNEIISEHKSSKIFYYEEKLYFMEHNHKGSLISCIDTDGGNYRVLYNEKYINNFIIHDDVIYMKVFAEEQDSGYMFDFYKYSLSDGSTEIFDDSLSLPHELGLCPINDKIYYNLGDITREYDTRTKNIKDYNIVFYNMQEFNGSVYSFSNHHIYSSESDNINEYTEIYEISEDYIIKRISVIDDLIFFACVNNYATSDEKFVHIDVINIDGTDRKNLLKFKYSTLGHYFFEYIYILNDRLIVISSDNEYPLFKILDFTGKEFYSLY